MTGIDFVSKNIRVARRSARKRGVGHLTKFETGNFENRHFPKGHFSKAYSIEGYSYATGKQRFAKVVHDLLKERGSLAIADFFRRDGLNDEQESLLRKWCDTWGYNSLMTREDSERIFLEAGFGEVRFTDHTDMVVPSTEKVSASVLKLYPMLRLLRGARVIKKLPHREAVINEGALFRGGVIRYGILGARK